MLLSLAGKPGPKNLQDKPLPATPRVHANNVYELAESVQPASEYVDVLATEGYLQPTARDNRTYQNPAVGDSDHLYETLPADKKHHH